MDHQIRGNMDAMALNDAIMELFRRDARKFTCRSIGSDHVKGTSLSALHIEVGKNYFRRWLSEMYLTKERDRFKSWHPVVH